MKFAKTPSTERESSLVQIAFRLFFSRQGFAAVFRLMQEVVLAKEEEEALLWPRYSQLKRLWRAAKEIIAKNLRATRCGRRKLIKMLTAKTLVCVGRFHYGQPEISSWKSKIKKSHVLVAQFFGHCERYTKTSRMCLPVCNPKRFLCTRRKTHKGGIEKSEEGNERG